MRATAQAPFKVVRIGFLSTATAASFAWRIDAMKAGLAEHGYVDGKSIVIEYRWAEFDNSRLPALAADLVRSNVDVIVTAATPATLAAKQATATIPIVMTAVGDAVGAGVVANFAHPDANVTGVSFLLPQLSAKRLELAKEVNPLLARVASFQNAANKTASDPVFSHMQETARQLKVSLQKSEVSAPHEFDPAFLSMAHGGVEAVVVSDDTLMSTNPKLIAELALKYRISAVGFPELANAGGLMAYGINRPAIFRRVAYFVDKVLKGVKPAELPVEQPTRFELVVNLRTARSLGLTIPQSLLLRADEVIQ